MLVWQQASGWLVTHHSCKLKTAHITFRDDIIYYRVSVRNRGGSFRGWTTLVMPMTLHLLIY